MTPTDNNHSIVDVGLLKFEQNIRKRGVGTILPFIILAFLIAVLYDYLSWRDQALDWLNRQYGAHWREKERRREELLDGVDAGENEYMMA